MNKLPPNLIEKLTGQMSRQSLSSFGATSKSFRAASQKAKTKRRTQMAILKAATRVAGLRSKQRVLSPQTQMMVEVSRVMAKLPKTHRHPNGSVYHPRQRLHNYLFQGKHLKPGVERRGLLRAIQFGNVPNGRYWFYHNGIAGGQFRNGQWITVIYPGFRAPFVVKANMH